MKSRAAFPSKVSENWRARPGRLLYLGLTALVLGCSQVPDPEVTGIAQFLLFDAFAGDRRFTLDTGAGGTQPIQSDATWDVDCNLSMPDSPWMYLARKDHAEVAQRDPHVITILGLGPKPESSPDPNVGAMLGDYYFVSDSGTCAVTFAAADGDPAAGTFSAENCDAATRFGNKGRLEFAKFHVTNCNTEPYK
ncbi:hypothetical protein WMF45_12480 [Sorangium sp. So ce448]|uniref:hypothetical protein n=1 Tax=Sorangium sp. So ce448 TaxID=3133314 RepID=UPI003F61BC6E